MLQLRFKFYRSPIFWIVVALTAIALVLGLGLAYFSAGLNTLFKDQQQYQSYTKTLNDLLLNLTTAETGQRGYLITQNNAYLDPYNKALPLIQSNLSELRDSPLHSRYQNEIDQMEDISTKKLDELKSTITALQTQGQAVAFDIVNTNSGNSDMISLRTLITNTSNDQNSKLQSEIATAENRTEILKYMAPIAAILDIGLIFTILYIMQRAIQKEQQLDNLKEQFLALASHQLRTPATAVKQYISLLLSGGFGNMKKEQTDVLNIINESNERGIKIANNLLNITRVDNGQANISEKPVDLSDFLAHVITHYKDAIQESKNQEMIVKMPRKHVMARVDQFYIRLIFENLIENASKYSDDNKKIIVSLKERSDRVVFSVKDHGQGINKKDIPLLFKKFSRLSKAIKKADGSGLGLYLVKQAAELHGGDVIVTSAENKGSTFTVTIDKGF